MKELNVIAEEKTKKCGLNTQSECITNLRPLMESSAMQIQFSMILLETIGMNSMNRVALLMNYFPFMNRRLIKTHSDKCLNCSSGANSMNTARIALT